MDDSIAADVAGGNIRDAWLCMLNERVGRLEELVHGLRKDLALAVCDRFSIEVCVRVALCDYAGDNPLTAENVGKAIAEVIHAPKSLDMLDIVHVDAVDKPGCPWPGRVIVYVTLKSPMTVAKVKEAFMVTGFDWLWRNQWRACSVEAAPL